MLTIIAGIIGAYGLLSISYLAMQFLLAHLHHLRHQRTIKRTTFADTHTITVLYPVYNESPEVLREVMERAHRCLEIKGLKIIIVDDGSPNREQLIPIYEQYQSDRIRIIYQANAGKRHAQYRGLQEAQGEFIITVDSDTLIDVEGIRRLIAPFERDHEVGAVCGEVLLENSRTNLLTRLLQRRYWSAFNLERAAQSIFRNVMCCSGPFSAYRAEILHRLKDAYISQTFAGKLCTYGDDRHLTNMVLGDGWRVVYEPEATAWTFTPDNLGDFIKQQTRWNKSFYRELIWSLSIAHHIHPYVFAEILLQPLLFIGYNIALFFSVFLIFSTRSLTLLLSYVGTILVLASLRSLYGLFRTRDPGFLLFCLYGFLHVFVLLPVRFKALATLGDNRWGTRDGRTVSPYWDFCKWAAGYWVILGSGAVLLYVFVPPEVTQALAYHRIHYFTTVGVSLVNFSAAFVYALVVLGSSLLSMLYIFRFLSKRSSLDISTVAPVVARD